MQPSPPFTHSPCSNCLHIIPRSLSTSHHYALISKTWMLSTSIPIMHSHVKVSDLCGSLANHILKLLLSKYLQQVQFQVLAIFAQFATLEKNKRYTVGGREAKWLQFKGKCLHIMITLFALPIHCVINRRK